MMLPIAKRLIRLNGPIQLKILNKSLFFALRLVATDRLMFDQFASEIPMSDQSIGLNGAQGFLDAFLVDNLELESLNALLAKFNILSTLRVDKVEIRHSNVLAWLLTPDGSHGLHALFLRRFLSRLLMDLDAPNISLTPSQFELMAFSDVEVIREWNNIDLLIRSASKKWCLLIENKIKSQESKGQLIRYLTLAREDMPGYEIIPVYLTLEGDEPSNDALEMGFLPVSYSQVLEIAEQIINQNKSRIPDDAFTFLSHYMETLRRLTMQDQKLIDLCKTIFRKHREAIELIIEYGAVSDFSEACISEVKSLVDCEFIMNVRGGVWFLPKEFGDLIPSQQLSLWKFLPRGVPIAFWYYYQKKRQQMKLVIEVGPLVDTAKRIGLLNALEKVGFQFGKLGFRQAAKYTRIFTVNQKLKVNEEGEPDLTDEHVRDVVASLWKKQGEARNKLLAVLAKFNWD